MEVVRSGAWTDLVTLSDDRSQERGITVGDRGVVGRVGGSLVVVPVTKRDSFRGSPRGGVSCFGLKSVSDDRPEMVGNVSNLVLKFNSRYLF